MEFDTGSGEDSRTGFGMGSGKSRMGLYSECLLLSNRLGLVVAKDCYFDVLLQSLNYNSPQHLKTEAALEQTPMLPRIAGALWRL